MVLRSMRKRALSKGVTLLVLRLSFSSGMEGARNAGKVTTC